MMAKHVSRKVDFQDALCGHNPDDRTVFRGTFIRRENEILKLDLNLITEKKLYTEKG